MVSGAQETLRRLRELVRSRAAELWLDEARVEKRAGGRRVLRVRGALEKRRLETRFASELEAAFGGPVDVIAEGTHPPPPAPPVRVLPRLTGPAGAYAVRVVRAFVEGGPAAAPLVVVYGPPHCGKGLLVQWAESLASRRVFRVDLERVRSGRSRGLIPRKPLVVAVGVERLAGRAAAQRTLCAILDAVQDRGDRLLISMAGHPAELAGIYPALRNRLKGGVLVRLEQPTPADMRRQLRERARKMGIRLPRAMEEELSALPPAEALRALEARLSGHDAPRPPLETMRDLAARLFGVERALLDGVCKRATVVAARRAVMTAAAEGGIPEEEIATSFGLKSSRAVREARRWALREEERDRRFAALLHELRRVLPRG
ncbi:MAG: hypothetical protein ACYTGV_04170 [Planctomycetota bacterium]|jgi:hypothetical protein